MITIVQQYDSKYKKIADLTTYNKVQYANTYGYTFLDYYCELKTGTPWYWHNTLGILKAIEDERTKGDWIFWTDPDSLIMNYSFDVKSLTTKIEDDVHIVASLWTIPANFILMDIATSLVKQVTGAQLGLIHQIHTGNFLIRRSKKSVSLLMKMYEDTRFKDNPDIIVTAGDEGVYAMYYISDLNARKMFKLLPTNIFCTLPSESYSYMKENGLMRYTEIQQYKPNDFILHALGRWNKIGTVEEWKYNILKSYVEGIR